jgi:hypothetical protein
MEPDNTVNVLRALPATSEMHSSQSKSACRVAPEIFSPRLISFA